MLVIFPCCLSDDGGSGTAVGSREKNRQAQQRFRQRQKDRIRDLEDENLQLKEQVGLWLSVTHIMDQPQH